MNINIETKLLKMVFSILTKLKNTNTNISSGLSDPILIESKNNEVSFCINQFNLYFKYSTSVLTKKEGSFVISALTLSTIVNSIIDKEVELKKEEDENTLLIKTNTGESSVLTADMTEFDFTIPKDVEFTNSIKINREIFLDGVKSVNHAASKSLIKPELSSVYMYKEKDTIYFVSTDAHRLAEKRIDISNQEEDFSVLISMTNMFNIIKIFESITDSILEINISKNYLMFSTESISLYVRTVNGTFPDYRKIFPKEFKIKFLLKKSDLQSFFKKATIFANDLNALNISNLIDNKIMLEFKNNLNGYTQDCIQVENLTNSECSLLPSYNYKYIADSIQNINDCDIEMRIVDTKISPVMIRGASEKSFTSIISPLIKQ